MKKGECIAKVKFWFGADCDIFDTDKYIIEHSKYDKNFTYIYEKVGV